MAALYGDYTRDRVGMFFGLTGVQLSILVVAAMPVLWAVNERLWASAGIAVLVWLVVFVLAVVPVRGRSATGWLLGLVSFTAGTVLRVEAIRELLGDNGLGMFACRILAGGDEIASANVSVFEPPDAMAYLESTTQ